MVTKSRLYWTVQILGWSLYAVIEIITSTLAAGGESNPKRLLFLCYESACCLLLTHLFRTTIIHLKWLNLGLTALFPRLVGGVVLLAAVMYFLRIPGSILLDMFLPEVIFSAGNIVGLSSVYVFIFFMWSVLYFVYNYFERYNNSLKLEASLKEIELNNLKSQLNPHFIFNALNSIRALVDENPGKSKQAITQLSGMLRSSLTSGREKLTPLKEEIRLVQDYLGLEMIRFEERLRPHYDIDPATENLMVPPLMIQTLVENGIKHGISKLTHGGSIEIGSKILNSDLRIWIRNTGSFKENEKNSGTGLANTRQRLMLLYGDRANLTILEEGNFVLTEIIIPL